MSLYPPLMLIGTPSNMICVYGSSPPRRWSQVGPPGPEASSIETPGRKVSARAAYGVGSRTRSRRSRTDVANPSSCREAGTRLAVTTTGASA